VKEENGYEERISGFGLQSRELRLQAEGWGAASFVWGLRSEISFVETLPRNE